MSHEKVVALLEDLRTRGPATRAELVLRLGWAESLVRGALDQLCKVGEVDFETRDAGGKVERVWWAESPPC